VDVTSTFPPLVFSAANGGFAIDGGVVVNSPGLTHEISYTATRTAPSPQTCTNFGFWTNPGGASDGPVAGNPTTRPDAAPLYTGDSEADVGTNDALLLMDQEMQAGPAGIPAASRFTVSVNGVARTVSAVQILNDDPPNQAILDLTFGGLPIASTDTVTVRYTRPLVSSQAALQDLEALKTASFGPVTIAVV
jgi:Putative flagellar system-associated repeat